MPYVYLGYDNDILQGRTVIGLEGEITIFQTQPQPLLFAAIQTNLGTATEQWGAPHIGPMYTGFNRCVNAGGYVDPPARINPHQVDVFPDITFYVDLGPYLSPEVFGNYFNDARTARYEWTPGVPVKVKIMLQPNGNWRSWIDDIPYRDSISYVGADRIRDVVYWTESSEDSRGDCEHANIALLLSDGSKFYPSQGQIDYGARDTQRLIYPSRRGVVMGEGRLFDNTPGFYPDGNNVDFQWIPTRVRTSEAPQSLPVHPRGHVAGSLIIAGSIQAGPSGSGIPGTSEIADANGVPAGFPAATSTARRYRMTVQGHVEGSLVDVDRARISLRRDGVTLRSIDVSIEAGSLAHPFTLDHIFTPSTTGTAFYSVFLEHLAGDLLTVPSNNRRPFTMSLRDVGAA